MYSSKEKLKGETLQIRNWEFLKIRRIKCELKLQKVTKSRL